MPRNLLEYCDFSGWNVLQRFAGKHMDIRILTISNCGVWDGDWQMGHKTVRNTDGRRKRQGLVESRPPLLRRWLAESPISDMPTIWGKYVLGICYDQVDYLSLHQYYGNRGNDSPDFLASSVGMR